MYVCIYIYIYIYIYSARSLLMKWRLSPSPQVSPYWQMFPIEITWTPPSCNHKKVFNFISKWVFEIQRVMCHIQLISLVLLGVRKSMVLEILFPFGWKVVHECNISLPLFSKYTLQLVTPIDLNVCQYFHHEKEIKLDELRRKIDMCISLLDGP